MTLTLHGLAQLSAERLLNCAAEGMLIALLAWFVLRAIGPRNSGTRFAVWFAALLGIAVLPLIGGWAGHESASAKPSEIVIPASWALYIFLAWLSVAAAGLLRVGISFLHLYRIRRSCVPVDALTLDPVLLRTLEESGRNRKAVCLCVSERIHVPTAIGFLKPMVVMPSWMMTETSTAELNAILLHELAHLGRRDDWTNLIQKILGALLFFHPAVWWINRRLSLEREMACDDLVLARTTDPHAYAECLVTLAEKNFLRRGLALAQAAVGRLRHISLRVTQILDVNRPKATRVWRPAPVLATGMSLVCLIAISYAPTRLISFESSAPIVATVQAAQPVPTTAANSEAGALASLGAQVVSAKLGTSKTGNSKSESATFVPAKLNLTGSKPGPVSAKPKSNALHERNQSQSGAPKLVRTSFDDTNLSGDPAAPQTWVLMMQTRTQVVQTRRVDASGAVVWDLSVWQVTVVAPAQINRKS